MNVRFRRLARRAPPEGLSVQIPARGAGGREPRASLGPVATGLCCALLIALAHRASRSVPAAIAAATQRHPGLQIRATGILGLEPVFLEVLDIRMREALSVLRVRELDALVLAAAHRLG